MKFKVGDRVKWLNSKNDITLTNYTGRKGTIVIISDDNKLQYPISVLFDKDMHVFNCLEIELKLLNSEKIKERLGVK